MCIIIMCNIESINKICLEGTPLYIPPLTYIVNKKIIKIQMNFLDNKTTISYYFGPSSTF